MIVKDTILFYGTSVSDVPFQIEYIGFVNGDSINDIRVAPELHFDSDYLEPGLYTLIPSKGFDKNYDIVIQAGILTIEELTNGAVKIFPNPVSDELNIVVDKDALPGRVSIISLSGSKVYEGAFFQPYEILHLSDVSPGLYIVLIEKANGATEATRLVVK